MKRLILLSAAVLLVASGVAVSRVGAQAGYICIAGFPANWTTYGGALVEWGSGRWFLPGQPSDNGGNPIMLAKADYPLASYEGVRGVRSMTVSWAFTGFSLELAEVGIQLIRGGALVDSYVEQHPITGSVQTFTANFSDRPVDYIVAYMRYSTAQGSLASVALRVEQVCFYPSRLDPTPTLIYTRTPTATRTATLTPSVTLTPSNTPPNYTPPATVPTAAPTVRMATMESRGFVTPVKPGDGCEDLTRPCALWGLPQVSTLSLPMPTGVTPHATLTLIPSYTYAFAPGGPGGGTGTPTPMPGASLGDVIPQPLGTLSTDGIDQFSALATETFYGAGTGGGGVDLRQAGYEIGANVGALFGYARMLTNADLGRVGTILSFLLLLIAFNLMLRVLLFIVPILFTIFRLIIDIIQAVVSALDAVIPF